MKKLEGKVALVTGGTSGMGREIARLFSAEGASAAVAGRNRERGESTVREIEAAGGKAVFLEGDVGLFDTNRRLIEATLGHFGGIDILVASAGKLGLGSVTDLSEEEWHRTLASNLHSVFYLLKAGIPALQRRGGGSIVVIGSIASFKGFPNHAAYCASKGALLPLVRQVAIDYAPSIRINLLAPGPVDTPLLHESARAFPDPESAVAEAAKKTLLERLGTPLDVARAALFLAGEDSSWMTGTHLTLDGGILTG